MNKLMNEKICTLLFLRKENEILLAMKKRGFGAGRWNGVGGKVETDKESVEQAAERETYEEIGVRVLKYRKVGENDFLYKISDGSEKRMYTHIYFSDEWTGEPTESEEMTPKWFNINDLPLDDMWPDDKYWLPEVLNGNKIVGTFTFDEQDAILSHDVRIVEKLPSER